MCGTAAALSRAQSLNVRYAGPALAPSTRYFWRVKVWDAAGKPYPESEIGWWETGLLTQDAWRAGWIGYETAEEAAVRNAPAMWIASPDAKALAAEKGAEQHFAYRTMVTLDKPVRHATLVRDGTGHGFSVGEWRAGADGRSVSAVEADAVEEVCARGRDGQAGERRQHDRD